jgi:O-antigen/teichoic acid export membrane protein
MSEYITNKKIAKNVGLSLAAQIISLLVGFVLYMIVPRFVSEINYSRWQVFVLYIGYVGILHFGILDGLMLRYSKYDYDEIDKAKVRSQLLSVLVITSIIGIGGIITSFFIGDTVTKYIIILVSIAVLTKNLFSFVSYSFQITNRINKYAIIVISQRVVYGLIVVILLVFKIDNFVYLCIAEIAGDVFAFLISIAFNKELYFGKIISIKETWVELKANVACGIILMLTNWTSSFITGGSKIIIQQTFDEIIFGQVSLAFSATSLFLTFITAISVVLFPSLNRMEEDKLPSFYKKTRRYSSGILVACLVFYYPGILILKLWLPQYEESLVYLIYIMPLIIFSSKSGLLLCNYLKLFRKEKEMLVIAIISIIVSAGLTVIFAVVVKDVSLALLSILLGVVVNSTLLEISVNKCLKSKNYLLMISEIVISAVFIVLFKYLNGLLAFGILSGIVLIYLVFIFYDKLIRRKTA